jgi:nucleotide-binding universal stress UspA family protein
MFSRIVVAWDGSNHARRAFAYGLELAKRFGSRLQLVSVAHHVEHAETQEEREESARGARRFYEGKAEELLKIASEQGVRIELLVVEGPHPAEAIVDTARKVGADLIIVGRRGLSGMTRFLLGSVSDRISRYAHCPVLIIDGFTTKP